VTIAGVGMMGGSLGLALREKKLAGEVMGWGRNEDKLRAARKMRALDSWTLNREEALKNSELLVLATPVGVTARIGPEWIAAAPGRCLVTDLGSVKGKEVERLTRLAVSPRAYVSSHPLCGSEKTGISAARSDLFENRICLLTPVAATRKSALGEMQRFWQYLGMRVFALAPARHDRIVASVSHLPHLLAAALVNRVGDEKLLPYTGTGFRDATRIAASDEGLWTGIIDRNRKEVIRELQRFGKDLDSLEKLIESGESATLKSWLRKAQLRRRKLELVFEQDDR